MRCHIQQNQKLKQTVGRFLWRANDYLVYNQSLHSCRWGDLHSVTVVVFASMNDHTWTNRGSEHFVLVHGACLGAWTWHKLVPLLVSAGHRVTSLDLSASGINLSRTNDVKSFSDYSKPVIDFMSLLPLNKRVILVGHSLGGVSISQAMELFPNNVAVGVFLTAFMPGPSLPLSSDIFREVDGRVLSALDNRVTFDDGPNNPPTTFIFGPKYTSQVLYQFSSSEDAALANLLLRPRPIVVDEQVFTEAKYGTVKRVYIVAEQDQVLKADLQNAMITQNPPNKVLTIRGSDHMVMISRTNTLYAFLLHISQDFA